MLFLIARANDRNVSHFAKLTFSIKLTLLPQFPTHFLLFLTYKNSLVAKWQMSLHVLKRTLFTAELSYLLGVISDDQLAAELTVLKIHSNLELFFVFGSCHK